MAAADGWAAAVCPERQAGFASLAGSINRDLEEFGYGPGSAGTGQASVKQPGLMSRILFVVPPLTGHINPTIAVGAELAARGHDVAWAGHPAALRSLLPQGARVFPVSGDAFDGGVSDAPDHRRPPRGPAAMKFVWETLIMPLAHEMLPGVTNAVAQFAPHMVVADQQAIAGAVAARRAGTVWVTSASTPGELLRPPGMQEVEAWVGDQMTAFQLACGVTDPADLRFSDRLVLVFTTAALIGDTRGFGARYVFTGPALARRPAREASFPWEWLDPARRHLLVTLGTLSGPAGPRFFRTVVDALADLGGELQAVLAAPPGQQAPPHILFAGHVPQLALLPHMSAVVCHGGQNTVCEALAFGLPLVVTPMRHDQPIIAKQVTDAGAGVGLRIDRLLATELRDAVRAVLDDPSYRAAAGVVRDSFAAAGGATTAADHLEKLV
jgi:MGT family glycosyltransferase